MKHDDCIPPWMLPRVSERPRRSFVELHAPPPARLPAQPDDRELQVERGVVVIDLLGHED